MLSFYNIWVIARYETKILFRSWFFRALALLTIGILTFLNIIFFSTAFKEIPWAFRGIPSFIPYFNLLMLNTVQAILTVFLASDFLKRDVKASSAEVIYMRSMSNIEYVLGKTGGILNIFFILNIVVLLIAAVINLVFSDVAFQFGNYLIYFILISIPTIIFISGLTYLLMMLTRSQPVTLVLLVGYITLCLFFLQHKANYLFDITAFYLPLACSDFIHIVDMPFIVLQRSIYFFAGLAFIFITGLLLKRLPQAKGLNKVAAVFSGLFFLIAVFFCITSVINYQRGIQLRRNMVQINDKYMTTQIPAVTHYYIDFEHLGASFSAACHLKVVNTASVPLDQYIFSLNPGLLIEKISANDTDLSFDRELHIIKVIPTQPLAPGDEDSLLFVYGGVPDDDASYLDIDESDRATVYNIMVYKVAKKFSFVTPNYVLLTKENLWYPVPGVTQGSSIFSGQKKAFSRFTLDVKSSKNLIPVSQGYMEKISDSEYTFSPETPLTQISLAIGAYKLETVNTDSIDYNLYSLKTHNYYQPYFTELGDTLKSIIRDSKRTFEAKLPAEYPFKRFSVVEVPVQYMAFPRLLFFHQENMQPEQVFIPENGITFNQADFRQQKQRFANMSQRRNQTFGEKEFQARLFNMFVNGFLGQEFGRGPEASFTMNFNIFPNYYSFINAIHSESWPVVDAAYEAYFYSNLTETQNFFARNWQGLLDTEKANLALKQHSLAEIVKDKEHKDLVNDVLMNKSQVLFKLLINRTGSESFDQYLKTFLVTNRFKTADFSNFLTGLENKINFAVKDYMPSWYEQITMPGYYTGNIQNYKVMDGNRTRYQIKFDVNNNESVDGLISVRIRTRGQGGPGGRGFGGPGFGGPGGMFGQDDEELIYSVDAGQTKQIGILLDSQPGAMFVNTLVSQNLPAEIEHRFEQFDLNDKATPFAGELVLDRSLRFADPNEIIVDNEDEGFKIIGETQVSPLKRLFKIDNQQDEEYSGLNMFRIPNTWLKTIHADFYGNYIHSASYIKSGNGSKKVLWTANLPVSGQYNVYCYSSLLQFRLGRFGGRPGGGGPPAPPGSGGNRGQALKDLHYTIFHDDGQEEVTLDATSAEEGWNFLGTFYLSQGSAIVELSDKTEGRIVTADAVKWVKH